MDFDYKRDTVDHYQNFEKASRYHIAYTQPRTLRELRSWLVARREIICACSLLRLIDVDKAIDIPAGTGKMAHVLAEKANKIIAIDISQSMLDIAELEYKAAGAGDVDFIRASAEEIQSLVLESDVILCVRLFHRVPKEQRRIILEGFSKVAPYVILTYGERTPWQMIRKKLLDFLLRSSDTSMPLRVTRGEFEAELSEWFSIEKRMSVIPFLSAEYFLLLKSIKCDREQTGKVL